MGFRRRSTHLTDWTADVGWVGLRNPSPTQGDHGILVASRTHLTVGEDVAASDPGKRLLVHFVRRRLLSDDRPVEGPPLRRPNLKPSGMEKATEPKAGERAREAARSRSSQSTKRRSSSPRRRPARASDLHMSPRYRTCPGLESEAPAQNHLAESMDSRQAMTHRERID